MIQVICGDALTELQKMPDSSVNCCVTSPPYFGLRDYGVAGQIGLEQTPDEYVAKMVEVFREVKRVLREDGVMFLNLGDSYYSGRFCGTNGIAKQGCLDDDCLLKNLCDECQADLIYRKMCSNFHPVRESGACAAGPTQAHKEYPSPLPDSSDSIHQSLNELLSRAKQYRLQKPTLSHEQLRVFPGSTIGESFQQPLASCCRCPNCGSSLSEPRSFSLCVLASFHISRGFLSSSYGTKDIALPCEAPEHHIQCTGENCLLRVSLLNTSNIQPYCTTNKPKSKDLIGIPWRVAFALQADGWYLRQDIIWCLSGGAWIYARTQKGDMPVMIKDLARLDPATVQLWNGVKWTQLLGMNKNVRRGDELEIVLRSGERISCTPTHKFPTSRGLIKASEVKIGDALVSCRLPQPDMVKDCAIDVDAAWFAGLYIAEGSMAGDTIQIAGHSNEEKRWERLQLIANKYGGVATRTVDGNKMDVRLYGKVLNAIISEMVTGKTAHDKGFAPVVWRYSDLFIESMIDGYLSGDGHRDGNRWRLGFCRNYNLERDLRTACARLGFSLTLNLAKVEYAGRYVPTFRGELRKTTNGYRSEKSRTEVVGIRKARCRFVYDLGVSDEPHLFSLASGILTHNSKPNPMPESVTDRCTKAHEYIFLLSKSPRYYYDADSIKEKGQGDGRKRGTASVRTTTGVPGQTKHGSLQYQDCDASGKRNKRSVWTVATKPYPEAHFATYPPDLIIPCIMAGCPESGTVLDPFAGSGTTMETAARLGRNSIGIELNPKYIELIEERCHEWMFGMDLFADVNGC